MKKYLFNDGINGVKEVKSDEELNKLVQTSLYKEKIRIWLFHSSEWISYADFISDTTPAISKNSLAPVQKRTTTSTANWLKRALVITLAGTTVFLVYNFTRIKWEKVAPLKTMASRPANVPIINMDSLIARIETSRGQKIDKITNTNLRIRNNWPDRILLHLEAQKETSNAGTRYSALQITIDNATGYQVDEAIVELSTWNNNQMSADTFHFRNIGYSMPGKKILDGIYKADSLSVSFYSIKATSFNFCYAADKESNYGNKADRWFCRE